MIFIHIFMLPYYVLEQFFHQKALLESFGTWHFPSENFGYLLTKYQKIQIGFRRLSGGKIILTYGKQSDK